MFKLEDCALKALQQVTTYTHTHYMFIHTLPFIVNTCTCITVQLENNTIYFLVERKREREREGGREKH